MPLVDTGKVTNMNSCFEGCSSLATIPLLNTEKVTNMNYCFQNCSSLNTIPLLNTGKVTYMNYCFKGCSSLTSIPELNTGKVTTMYGCFNGCSSLTTIPELNTENVSDIRYCFDGCSSLTSIPELNTGKVYTVGSCFSGCTKLKRISGISFKSMGSLSSYANFFFGYSSNTTCSYILLKDIGTNSACTTLDLTYARAWGVVDTDNPDARQSLIDSLLTYSFDRASAGYSNCTIKLYSTVKALLTQEEIDAITAKGYIIS
jgi:surface protein